MGRARSSKYAAWALGALALSGCYLSHGRRVPSDSERGMDAGTRDGSTDAWSASDALARVDSGFTMPGDDDAGPPIPLPCEEPQGVDFLLVLDDSGSIRPRDAQLRDRLGRLVRGLVRPPDRDGDGWEDWPRVTDLHLGVVSTSVRGTAFCAHTADGRLAYHGADEPQCAREYPRFQTYRDGESDPDALATAATCIAFGPREGCTVEQPLEAMAKALLPHEAPFTYIAGEPHGDDFNAGFLREESVLVVLFVGDEDDCSVLDLGIFERPDSGVDAGFDAGRGGIPGCRLARPDQFQPISRYAAMLDWLRPRHPERVVIGMIIAVEADPVITDPIAEPPQPCWGAMFYPRRMVELAQAFRDRSILGSICSLGEAEVVNAIADRIAGTACEE